MSARALPLAQSLAHRGHKVQLVIPPWDNLADSGKVCAKDGVTIRNIAVPSALQPLTIAASLVREAYRFSPDVVHLFKPKGHSGMAALLLSLLQRPFVLDADDWEGAGGWNTIGGYPRHYRWMFSFQQTAVPRLASSVTVASRELERMYTDLGVPSKSIFYLPNGASKEKYRGWDNLHILRAKSRQNLGLGDEPAILLYTRFFEFEVERVIAILREVSERIPDVKLIVAGRGFFGEEDNLARLARDSALAGRIIQLGWTDSSRIPEVMSAADVAIYPFDNTLVNRTKCSVKLIDLLAAGLPVVADRVGQNAEYIRDGESGTLVEPGDTAAFAHAVIQLLRDEGLRCKLAAAARARLWENFDWDDLAAIAEAAYSSLSSSCL